MLVLLKKLSKLDKCLRLYKSAASLSSLTGKSIFQHVLDELDISLIVQPSDKLIPLGGSIIISNHPTGILDGVLIGTFLDQIGTRYKLVTNSKLPRLDRLVGKFIFVCPDPKTNKDIKRNAASLREIIAFVKSGGCCVIFPSGEVEGGAPAEWSPTIAYLAGNVRCNIVPIYIHEESSISFKIGMLFGAQCRVFCLPRQLFAKKHKHVRLSVGEAIEAVGLRDQFSSEQMTCYLRDKVLALSVSQTPISEFKVGIFRWPWSADRAS